MTTKGQLMGVRDRAAFCLTLGPSAKLRVQATIILQLETDLSAYETTYRCSLLRSLCPFVHAWCTISREWQLLHSCWARFRFLKTESVLGMWVHHKFWQKTCQLLYPKSVPLLIWLYSLLNNRVHAHILKTVTMTRRSTTAGTAMPTS